MDRPWRSELVTEHAKAHRSERLLEGHLHSSVLRQAVEDTLRLCRIFNINIEHDGNPLRSLIALWMYIRSLQ